MSFKTTSKPFTGFSVHPVKTPHGEFKLHVNHPTYEQLLEDVEARVGYTERRLSLIVGWSDLNDEEGGPIPFSTKMMKIVFQNHPDVFSVATMIVANVISGASLPTDSLGNSEASSDASSTDDTEGTNSPVA